jgi:hypothetical protein
MIGSRYNGEYQAYICHLHANHNAWKTAEKEEVYAQKLSKLGISRWSFPRISLILVITSVESALYNHDGCPDGSDVALAPPPRTRPRVDTAGGSIQAGVLAAHLFASTDGFPGRVATAAARGGDVDGDALCRESPPWTSGCGVEERQGQ